jgi:hypothetical protein
MWKTDEERSSQHAAKTKRRLARKAGFISVCVTVQNLPKQAQIKPLVIHCCEGNQLIKWLSLTVSTRISSYKPCGGRRTRERFKVGTNSRDGFMVPGEVVSTDDELIDPSLKIKDVFRPGQNECFIRLGPTVGSDCFAKQEISAFGVPKAYMSPFAQRAFYPRTAASLTKYDALKERVEKKAEDLASMKTRWELRSGGKQQITEEDVMAANFKKVMSDQSGFGEEASLEDAEEVAALLALTVDQSFQQMSMCRLKQISMEDQALLKEKVISWLDLIDNVFKFYSGFGAGGGVSTMSRNEFGHFIAGEWAPSAVISPRPYIR